MSAGKLSPRIDAANCASLRVGAASPLAQSARAVTLIPDARSAC
jgi:hypothetical protein